MNESRNGPKTNIVRDRQTGLYGNSLARAFNLRPEIAVTPAVPSLGDRKFAITRIKSNTGLGAGQLPAEPAFLVSVAIEGILAKNWRAWIDGKEFTPPDWLPNQVGVVDLESAPAIWSDIPTDFLHIYIPRCEVEEIAREHGIQYLGEVKPVIGVRDIFIANLARLIAKPLTGEPTENCLRLDHARLLLSSHLIQKYAGSQGLTAAPVCKLAPWQQSRAMAMLRSDLAETVRLCDLASECGLSASHFARCFKATFGISVHQSLIKFRVESAQNLLAHTRYPIADIAIQSGFSDQAAFTRTFKQLIGTSPARWRRDFCTL